MSEYLENLVSDFVDEVSYEFHEFKNSTSSLKRFRQNQKIPFISQNFMQPIIIWLGKKDFDFCQNEEKLFEVYGWILFWKTQVKKGILTTWFKLLHIWNAMSCCQRFIDGEKIIFKVLRVYKKISLLDQKMLRG